MQRNDMQYHFGYDDCETWNYDIYAKRHSGVVPSDKERVKNYIAEGQSCCNYDFRDPPYHFQSEMICAYAIIAFEALELV